MPYTDGHDQTLAILHQSVGQVAQSCLFTFPLPNQASIGICRGGVCIVSQLLPTEVAAVTLTVAILAPEALMRGLHVTGKGGVEGEVPVSDTLMADFARYRTFCGLPSTPISDSVRPLILGIAGRTAPLTATAVYLVVKDALGRVADTLAPTDPARAARLRRASTHWLRHTVATHQAEAGNPAHHIQHNLRHSSIATTSIYLHAEDDARHASTTQAHAAALLPRGERA